MARKKSKEKQAVKGSFDVSPFQPFNIQKVLMS